MLTGPKFCRCSCKASKWQGEGAGAGDGFRVGFGVRIQRALRVGVPTSQTGEHVQEVGFGLGVDPNSEGQPCSCLAALRPDS